MVHECVQVEIITETEGSTARIEHPQIQIKVQAS